VSRLSLFQHLAQLRDEMSYSPTIMLAVLASLLFCLGAAVVGSRLAALALVPLAGAWLLSNQLVEGRTLLALSYRHGVTTADLLSVVALLVAAWRLLPPVLRFLSGSSARPVR
jgi:hypothetical protein